MHHLYNLEFEVDEFIIMNACECNRKTTMYKCNKRQWPTKQHDHRQKDSLQVSTYQLHYLFKCRRLLANPTLHSW